MQGVTQHAIALMLALTNKIKEADTGVRTGRFDERMAWGSIEISERTLGIIGLGRIGRRTAHKAALGLGMNVLAYDPYVDRSSYDGPAVFIDELDELLRQADVVTLHVPLTDETRHIIDEQSIAHMRPESYLINTARGAAVDEKCWPKRCRPAGWPVPPSTYLPKSHPTQLILCRVPPMRC